LTRSGELLRALARMRGIACAATCLPAGFGVAAATGVRPLGGIVLLVLAALAGRLSGAPVRRQALWYLVVASCFVASHLLADATGAWGAVAIVAVVATGAYVAILRPPAYAGAGTPTVTGGA
jgi:hypothetical protein